MNVSVWTKLKISWIKLWRFICTSIRRKLGSMVSFVTRNDEELVIKRNQIIEANIDGGWLVSTLYVCAAITSWFLWAPFRVSIVLTMFEQHNFNSLLPEVCAVRLSIFIFSVIFISACLCVMTSRNNCVELLSHSMFMNRRQFSIRLFLVL